MKKNKLLLIIIFLFFLGCQPLPGGHPASDAKPSYIEIPEELKQQVDFAGSMGELIYLKDKAAELATDELMRRGVPKNTDIQLKGWITVKNDDGGWKVIFISEKNGDIKGCYTLEIQNRKVVKDSFIDHNAGLDLTHNQLNMFKARQLAVSQKFRRCSINYNTVLIPREDVKTGEKFIYVYLLASADPKNIPVIGHHRVKVSHGGDKIIEFTPMSRTCISTPPGGTMSMLTHLLSPTPSEAHVLYSLRQRHSIKIITTQNSFVWKVDGNQIRLLGRV